MKIVLQRVNKSSVRVNNEIVAEIGRGITLLVAIHNDDTEENIRFLAEKCLGLRVFPDKDGRMNLSIKDIKGDILSVPQFTLYGRTRKGTRPDYHESAEPKKADQLYNTFLQFLHKSKLNVHSGIFGAKMQVDIQNDGPVTLILEK